MDQNQFDKDQALFASSKEITPEDLKNNMDSIVAFLSQYKGCAFIVSDIGGVKAFSPKFVRNLREEEAKNIVRGIDTISEEDYNTIMKEAAKPASEFKPNQKMVEAILKSREVFSL